MSNYTLSPEEIKELKREKLDAIREYHKDLIKDLGIHFMDFNMKMPFYDLLMATDWGFTTLSSSRGTR